MFWLVLTIFAGVLSAVFNISLEFGQPMVDMVEERGAGVYEGNAKLLVSTSGCFVVNAIWFTVLGFKRNTLKEMGTNSGLELKELFKNYSLSALAGTLWCF